MRIDRLVVDIVGSNLSSAADDAKEAWRAFIETVFHVGSAGISIAFIPIAVLFGIIQALYRLVQDSQEVRGIIQRMRAGSNSRSRVCEMVEARINVFPNSRAYRAIQRCCKNERRKVIASLKAEYEELTSHSPNEEAKRPSGSEVALQRLVGRER